MTPPEWKERYIARLVKKGDFTYRIAKDILMDRDHDYTSDPEAAADEELGYWRENG